MELTIEQTLRQGVAAHRDGNFYDAECLYRAVIASQPRNPDANHNLGILAVGAEKYEAAIPLFKMALEVNPKVEQFWLSLVETQIKENQIEAAKGVIAQAKSDGMHTRRLKLLEAKCAILSQSVSGGGEESSDERMANILEYYEKEQFDIVEELAFAFLNEFPKHQFGWKVLGAIFGRTERYEEALEAHQTSADLSPQDAEAFNNLGSSLKELGRMEEAEASYIRAIALDPNYVSAHNNLGVMLQGQGRLIESEKIHAQAISLSPESAEAHFNLGNTLRELGKLQEAEASYNRALDLKPNYVEVLNNLGNTYMELGRPDDARDTYTMALKYDAAYPETHYNIGAVFQEMGMLGDAEKSYKKAIALDPFHARAHGNLGLTLKELGRLEEAEPILRHAIELKPDFPGAHNNLGELLMLTGKHKEGLKELEAANGSINFDLSSGLNF